MKLSDRVFKCKDCGLVLDRDYNAAINILKFGCIELGISFNSIDFNNIDLHSVYKYTVGHTGINVCGEKSSGLNGSIFSSETIFEKAEKRKLR